MKITSGRPAPYITAHAGCMDTLPNSRQSILAALASEADIVEVDVRASRDNVIILSHDDYLDLPDGTQPKVGDLDWQDMERYSPASGSAILRIEYFLDLAAQSGSNKILNLDIKESSALARTASIIRSHNLEEAVVFSGLGREGIRIAREQLKSMTYFFNADEMLPLSGTREADMNAACSLASEMGCRGINLEWTRASASFVEYAKARGLIVMLWTVDTEAEMLTALSFKPDSLTTNYPDLLARLMRQK